LGAADEIQIAIYDDDRARLEMRVVKLALTRASLGIPGLPCSAK
jgi:hypothetical protein